jgi:hypothetical protein
MDIKLRTLVDSIDAVKDLVNKEIPIKTAFKLSKLIKEINSELEHLERAKAPLFDKYEEKITQTEGPIQRRIAEEHISKYFEELAPVLDMDVKLSIDSKIKLDDLGDIKISAVHLDLLNWLLE